MKISFKLIKNCFVLLIIIFSYSCALHAKFPFICFKKDCIKMQFSGVRKEAGGNRSIKQRAKIIAAKIKQKKTKLFNKANIKLSKKDYETAANMLIDSTLTGHFIKIVFFYKINDTINASLLKDSINLKSSNYLLTKNNKILIKYCLNKHQIKNINQILINAEIFESDNSSKTIIFHEKEMNKLKKYLSSLGVRKSKIKIR